MSTGEFCVLNHRNSFASLSARIPFKPSDSKELLLKKHTLERVMRIRNIRKVLLKAILINYTYQFRSKYNEKCLKVGYYSCKNKFGPES